VRLRESREKKGIKEEKDEYSPTRMRINAGSSATFVRRDRLLKVSFSVHAQTPTAMIPRPSHYERERGWELEIGLSEDEYRRQVSANRKLPPNCFHAVCHICERSFLIILTWEMSNVLDWRNTIRVFAKLWEKIENYFLSIKVVAFSFDNFIV